MKNVLLFVTTLSIAVAAHAATLKEKKLMVDWNETLKTHVALAKTHCGHDIPATLDENLATPFIEAERNPSTFCDAALSTLATMCDDATAKAEIAQKVKSVHCTVAAKNEVKLTLAGGKLNFAFGPAATNLEDKVKAFLENNL